MRVKSAIAAMAALIVSTASALALESSMTVPSPLSPDALWKKVGDFCGMTAWNPAVEKCVLSADGKQRTLSFFGSFGTAVATLDNWDNTTRSYTFTNVSGLLPVSNYHATVSVIENANGSALKMTATYEAKGVPDADAKRAADGAMYRSLCFNSPLLCSPEQRSVAPAELVKFDSVPPGPAPLILQGYLRRPSGAGPFPAVVLLHGCGGYPEPLDQDWGVKVASWGHVTLTIDSFGPRGIKNTCQVNPPVDIFFDAYRGLNFLARQQFVDPKRVAVVGFSQGGWITLSSVERGAIEQASENKFRAAAAFYPLCKPIRGPMTVPTLIMIGESDDWTTADAWVRLPIRSWRDLGRRQVDSCSAGCSGSFVATTNSNHFGPIFPNLAKGLTLKGPNELWVADLTYIAIARGFVYLAVVLDAGPGASLATRWAGRSTPSSPSPH